MSHWIAVDERLPDPWVKVLVLFEPSASGTNHAIGYIPDADLVAKHGDLWWPVGARKRAVTHWMPLPAYPAGDKRKRA